MFVLLVMNYFERRKPMKEYVFYPNTIRVKFPTPKANPVEVKIIERMKYISVSELSAFFLRN